jgi:hypothetical protein
MELFQLTKDNAAITEGEEVERLHLDDKNDYSLCSR